MSREKRELDVMVLTCYPSTREGEKMKKRERNERRKKGNKVDMNPHCDDVSNGGK